MKGYVFGWHVGQFGWHVGQFGLCVDHAPTDPAWFDKVHRAVEGLTVMLVGHAVPGCGKPDRVEFSAKSARSLRRLVPRLRRIGPMHMVLVKGNGPLVTKLPLRVSP